MVREASSGEMDHEHDKRNDNDEMGMGMGMVMPAWLQGLMAETFFGGCGVHENLRKNEKNIFCLHCCSSICPHCLPSHRTHPLLQVRRYVYHDVVRLGDLEKLIDCSLIQPYTINSAKVIFVNQRPQSRSCKGAANLCLTCERILQEDFHFCSLFCKVHFMQGHDLSSIIHKLEDSDFALRMGEMMMDDVDEQLPEEEDEAEECGDHDHDHDHVTRHPEVVVKKNKKKKGSGSFLPGLMLSLGSRRKGAPHRAPFS